MCLPQEIAGPIPEPTGALAQSVEQLTFNQLVAGSNPARPTTNTLFHSEYISKETNVSNPIPPATAPVSSESGAPVLDFHEEILGIAADLQPLAILKLQAVPEKWRQAILDDLAVRVLERKP